MTVFRESLHLLCDLHMRSNIDDKMREYKLDPSLCIDIREKIFGKRVGSKKISGLVDSSNDSEFDNTVIECIKEWEGVP